MNITSLSNKCNPSHYLLFIIIYYYPSMSRLKQEPRSSSAAYREIYLWDYDFNQVLDIDPQNQELKLETLLSKMTIWLGKLYDVAAESTFSAYYQELLNYKEMKIFFAACLILHTVRFMRYLQNHQNSLWTRYRQQIMKVYDQNSTLTLDFLMMKFPQKEVGSVDPDLEKLLPVFDRTEDPNTEILNCIGLRFTGQHTLQQIKQMMNLLIKISKELLNQFRKDMTEIFTLKQGDTDVKLTSLQGMKFRDTMQTYSQKQIKEIGMKIKGPQMLRIMIKWIQELQKKCKDVDKYIINRYYPFNTKNGQLKKLNYKQKDQLAVRIKEYYQNVKDADKKNVKQINSILFDLFKFITIQKQNFKYIQEKEVTVGLFTHILSQSVSNIVSQYLEFLINNICKASEDIDFITFGVSDLLRCKCSGTKKQIKEVYEKIQKKFTIVRVKNRLKTSNNDFMVNFKYKGLTVECQLGFNINKKQQNQKAYYQNSFSHFLYEMARSKFSPLTEIVIINNHLNQTVGFFQGILKKNNKKEKSKELQRLRISLDKNKIAIEGYHAVKNTFPMFCNYCWQYKGAYQSFLDMYVSKDRKNVCGQCYMSCLSPNQITQYLLGQKLANFFQKVPLNHLLSFQDFQEHYVILLFKSYNKNINVYCKPKGIEQFCPVFSKFKGKYEFNSPSKLKQISFFAFTIKKQLKLFKEFKQILQNHGNIAFIQPAISFQNIKNNRQELLFVQSSTQTLVLNNENTQQTKRQRYRQLKFQTLVDKNWWLMQSESIDENFFDNPKILKHLTKVLKLQISDNNLKDIKFLIRNSLTHLNISSNNIIEIEFIDFDFGNLKFLDLSRNILTQLKLSGCNLGQLDTLIATSNKISWCFVEDANLQMLSVLKLNNNRLETIIGFNDLELENLEVLHLEENLLIDTKFFMKGEKITNINRRFPKLKQLFFENNKIRSFDGFIESEIQGLEQMCFGSPETIELQKWNKCKLHFLKTIEIKNSRKIEGVRIFTKFFGLKKIVIRENVLTSIELSDLNLKYLEVLTITQNSLEKVQGLKRATLSNLKTLDLTKNSLKSFDFTNINFPELTHFHLENNSILTLQNIKTSLLPKLQELQLENNHLLQFHLSDLNNFHKLSTLNLSRNRIKNVLGGGYTLNLPNLRTLNLGKNQLQDFYFPSLPHLEVLYLNDNQLVLLKNINKCDSPYLKEIYLNFNRIKEFDFRDVIFPSLRILNLCDNQMTSITYLQLCKLPLLTTLLLSNNQLSIIDFGGNPNFPKLKLIDLSNNKLTQIKGLNKKQSKLISLQKLILSNNSLKSFEFDRLDLPQLKQLQLSKNSIDKTIFFKGAKLPSLLSINLQSNSIQMIDFAQAEFSQLVSLNLKHNKITELQNLSSAKFQNLRKLELDHNKMNRLELDNVSFEALESLDCTFNLLKVVNGLENAKLSGIKRISLEHNKIMTFNIMNCPVSYPFLELINLQSNQINTLNFNGSYFPVLNKIILKSNRLKNIKSVIDRKLLPKLETLLINKNLIQQVDFGEFGTKVQIKKEGINVEKKQSVQSALTQIVTVVKDKTPTSNPKTQDFDDQMMWTEIKKPQYSTEEQVSPSFLSQINLDQNKITKITFGTADGVQVDTLKSLKKLSIGFNSLKQLNLKGLNINSHLQVLYINDNKNLTSITGFQHIKFSELLELHLQKNNLSLLPFTSANFDKLQLLNLSNNSIQSIQSLKDDKMPSLKALKLSHNTIKYLNFKSISFNTLIRLDVDDNDIQAVDNLEYAKLPYLQILNLRKNKLKKMDFKNVFMYRLKNLILADNELKSITNFKEARFPNMISLDLCNNRLRTLDITSGLLMTQLQKLMLHNNKLQDLTGIEDRMKMLKMVTINNNPIANQPKYSWIKERYENPKYE